MSAHDVADSYDRVADAYAAHFGSELDRKPLDRELLALYARLVRGPVLEVGCGPGHIGEFLATHDVVVSGLDIAPEMIAAACRLHPRRRFEVGDMCELGARSLAGIVGFYALCNLAPGDLPRAARSFAAALAPGGWLLVSFHAAHDGPPRVHLDELLGVPVSLDFWFHSGREVAAELAAHGLDVCANLVRGAYAGAEYPSSRAYLLARKPG